MRSLGVRHVLTCLLFCWVFAFLWLLQKERYTLYLRPDFRWLIIAGCIFLSFFVLALLFPGGRLRKTSTLEIIVRSTILILPLVYMRAMDGQTLGLHALALRSVDGQKVSSKGGFVPGKKAAGPIGARTGVPLGSLVGVIRPDWVKAIKELKPKARGKYQKASIVKIKSDYLKNYGKRVETIGMVFKDERLPPGTFLVFQFHIVCCAADAMPQACLVQYGSVNTLTNDKWVRVRGVTRTGTFRGQTVALLQADKISSIATPANPYTY